ncbi:MAG: hypothetical protein AAGA60_07255 [Cyanobacteria bacterium P01_E01_bin.42]
MRKWVIFRADKRQPGWENRKLEHTQSLTKILAEHFDCSDKEIPQPGYRPPDFVRVEQLADPQYPAAKTHYRQGDWEVVRVETYTPEIPLGEFDMVVICYCQYSPINADLKPMPDRQVSPDSFGGDETAYQDWLEKKEKDAIAM